MPWPIKYTWCRRSCVSACVQVYKRRYDSATAGMLIKYESMWAQSCCTALWANDVTYLGKQCKHAHTSMVYLAVGYMFTHGNPSTHLLKAFTHTHHIHTVCAPTSAPLVPFPQQTLTLAKPTGRLKCLSPVSGSQIAHLKWWFGLFSNPHKGCEVVSLWCSAS